MSNTKLSWTPQIQSNLDIFHDLMQVRVKEVLIVSTCYDAFVLQQEGQISEKIFDEYYSLNLSNAPRITNTITGEQTLELIQKKKFDMVILMLRIEQTTPFELSAEIKKQNPELPVLLLLKDNTESSLFKDQRDMKGIIDKVFVWNGDPKIFLAMIKYIEDKKNVAADTSSGMVRVILLVEDSIRYYSRYLPILYSAIITQVQHLIKEENLNEPKKLLRMRARPKILLADCYEDAVKIVEEYKAYLLCVISDVAYAKNGRLDDEAGFKFIRYVKNVITDIPTVIQSSDTENAIPAEQLASTFINKNSERLAADLNQFLLSYLGFGDFLFRDSDGKVIERARTLQEMEIMLGRIPESSLLYHSERNHFSSWLMARGEIKIATTIHPMKIRDFETPSELRLFLIQLFRQVNTNDLKGAVVNFRADTLQYQGLIYRLADGALGGKGRSIAFVNSLIYSSNLLPSTPQTVISIPRTAIIGTEEFDQYLIRNKLLHLYKEPVDEAVSQQLFLNGTLSPGLLQKLTILLEHSYRPLAVRSSGLFEDSISYPFSGVYPTYFIPNNSMHLGKRLNHLTMAIKLIYSAVFSKSARSYFEAVHYTIEEEKMAVVIQEVIGQPHGDWFYPHLSGVAQSYNYYPFAYIQPEDGLITAAVGLGKYVTDGENAFRFCPRHPNLEMISPKDLTQSSQTFFYALNMTNQEFHLKNGENTTLAQLSIYEAERRGVLEQTASVWDAPNERLSIGLECDGPRVINFGPILKWKTFPLAQLLDYCLSVFKSALGTPVEIEFAADLTHNAISIPTLHILQVKHYISNDSNINLEPGIIDHSSCLLFTNKGMGNGKLMDIYDIVYIDPDRFDRAQTPQMALELEKINQTLRGENSTYILIGPGRWGSRDKWLGIPVMWSQISNARVIVETELADFRVDASLGSHFFHTITSMNIGYFTVPFSETVPPARNGFIDWEWLKQQTPVQHLHYAVHIRSHESFTVLMDGRKGISVIYKPTPGEVHPV